MPFIEFFNLFNRNNPGANYVTDISALPVPVNNLFNATALCPTPACSVPITNPNQLLVPSGALGDFFGPGNHSGYSICSATWSQSHVLVRLLEGKKKAGPYGPAFLLLRNAIISSVSQRRWRWPQPGLPSSQTQPCHAGPSCLLRPWSADRRSAPESRLSSAGTGRLYLLPSRHGMRHISICREQHHPVPR